MKILFIRKSDSIFFKFICFVYLTGAVNCMKNCEEQQNHELLQLEILELIH